MSLNTTVARTRSLTMLWRSPVTNSSINPREVSVSSKKGRWSVLSSSTNVAPDTSSADWRPRFTLTIGSRTVWSTRVGAEIAGYTGRAS